MHLCMDKLDWALLKSFVAVAQNGSLSAAAQSLRMSQPSVGRHIRQLEDLLGYPVFQRHSKGLDLTVAGQRLLPSAIAMSDAAHDLMLTASGQSVTVEGTVRITSSVFLAQYILPPIIAELRIQEPGIDIELVPNDSSENLLYHEADIAIRMYRPTQLDVITQHLGDIKLGLFASRSYVEKFGVPQDFNDFRSHQMVGYDRDQRIIDGMADLGIIVSRDDFPVRCDNQTVYWELVRAGCGIGVGQTGVGCKDPDLVPVLPGIEIPPLPVWLTSHEKLRNTPRVDRVWTLLKPHLLAAVS